LQSHCALHQIEPVAGFDFKQYQFVTINIVVDWRNVAVLYSLCAFCFMGRVIQEKALTSALCVLLL
jgi:hypothetical protein